MTRVTMELDGARAMNKIVREHYPVEKLPEDLRAGLEVGQKVTVTLEEEVVGDEIRLEDIEALLANSTPITLEQARALVGTRSTTAEEAVARIRALRDEWDN